MYISGVPRRRQVCPAQAEAGSRSSRYPSAINVKDRQSENMKQKPAGKNRWVLLLEVGLRCDFRAKRRGCGISQWGVGLWWVQGSLDAPCPKTFFSFLPSRERQQKRRQLPGHRLLAGDPVPHLRLLRAESDAYYYAVPRTIPLSSTGFISSHEPLSFVQTAQAPEPPRTR